MSIEFVKEYYYVICIVILLGAFLLFVRGFESRKPGAREVVILAVMSAIAVASRAVFVMIPFVKPILGIIMITGIAFGVEAGFLTGAVSALVSNFIFGQGPWTPWQSSRCSFCRRRRSAGPPENLVQTLVRFSRLCYTILSKIEGGAARAGSEANVFRHRPE